MLIFATYLPTLVSDYVPQDQWRAFRYRLEPGSFGSSSSGALTQSQSSIYLQAVR